MRVTRSMTRNERSSSHPGGFYNEQQASHRGRNGRKPRHRSHRLSNQRQTIYNGPSLRSNQHQTSHCSLPLYKERQNSHHGFCLLPNQRRTSHDGPSSLPNQRQTSHRTLLLLSDEILLRIYLHAGGIDAVRALMCTSRRLWQVFDKHPVLIFESVLHRTMPDRLVAVIRAVWDLRYRTDTPTMDLRALLSVDDPTYLPPMQPPPPLDPEVPAAVVRDFMALASRIHGLAHIILDDCLARLVAVHQGDEDSHGPTLHPFPMLYPDMQMKPSYPYRHDRAPHVDTMPFLRPPCRTEELRMIHGLWLCEFHHVMSEARDWVYKELADLPVERLQLERFFHHDWRGTFWTIQHGLDALNQDIQAGYDPPEDHSGNQLPVKIQIPQRLRPADAARARRAAIGCRRAPLIPWAGMSREEREDMQASQPETDGYRFLAGLSAGTAAAPAFAHLGVLHWSRSRMYGLGLVHGDDSRIPHIWYSRLLDYWLSLLAPHVRQHWLDLLPKYWWKMPAPKAVQAPCNGVYWGNMGIEGGGWGFTQQD